MSSILALVCLPSVAHVACAVSSMDLTALWTREKARLAAELHVVTVAPTHGVRRASLLVPTHESDVATSNRLKASVVSPPSPTVAKPKKKLTVPSTTAATSLRDRERVFHLLLDKSIAPSSAETAPHFFGRNGFAMEYADRAVRRVVPQPVDQQKAAPASPAPASNAVVAFSSPSRGPTARTLSIRANATPIHAQTPSPAVPVAQSAVQTAAAFPAMTKNAQILVRKNGRKRAGTEYSSQALKPYGGDVFGTRGEYIEGMLYMSRMKRSYQAMVASAGGSRGKKMEFYGANPPWEELVRAEGRGVLKDGVSDAFEVAAGGTGDSKMCGGSGASRRTGSTITISTPSEDDGEPRSTLTSVQRKQQQRCSLTLSNWSFNPENARLMVQENVVEALIRLCKDGDKTTRLHCVTAFMNLSHLGELRRVIVQQGAVTTVAEVVNDMEDKTIRTACAITLCNLCSLQGEEGLLVEDGAVSALSTLINEHETVSHICRCALFNLTCVPQSYHKIESVLKAFIALTSTRNGSNGFAGRTEEEYDDVTAKALCNLSNLKRIRLRLMEEGIVSAIASLLHPNMPLIQELLAHILLNLSRLPTCRNEMVAKGCMGTLVALAGASSALTTKCLIGITLWNLSKDPGNAVRMVLEGLLLLVNELCQDVRAAGDRADDVRRDFVSEDGPMPTSSKDEELLQVCARTLYNVSCCEDSRVKLVERDVVNTLTSLSRRSSGDDAKQMCTLALCNLLSVQKAAADIVTAGAITALIQLSMAPGQSLETRNLFSKALHGLCDKAATRAAVTDAGVLPALLFLASIDVVDAQEEAVVAEHSEGVLSEIRARCTVAFACLAADSHTAVHVCNAAVVQCVTRILALEHANVAIERFCCSCLSLLCRDEQCSLIMVEVGALEMVLATCVESHDQESKASCCHVLASVSCHPSCCMALVRMGVISVLATLAKIKEDATIQRCCAITLANLSVEPEIRATLASAGIVAIVAVLSNSYSEDSQRDCAKVLCNLSCIRGNEAALVGEGAVGVLMMISMVRAVSVSTKETCIRALLNLLNAETMKHMVKEGLVKILSVYAGLASKQVATLVTIIFGKLLNHPVGRNALCAERSSLHALFQLMTYEPATPRSDADERRFLTSLHENLLRELVFYENSRLLSVHTGILDALGRISMYGDLISDVCDQDRPHASQGSSHCAEKTLALVFFSLAKSEDSRMAVASSSNLGTVLTFLNLHAAKGDCDASECVVYAAATLCWLGWHEDTRRFLQTSDIPRALTHMLRIYSTTEGKAELLSYSSQAIKTCVLTLCCLTHSSELLEVMLRENVVTYLNGILTPSPKRTSDGDRPAATESHVSTDEEFVALVCILFRQLSHVAAFATAIAHQAAPILELFCNIVQHVVAQHDIDSSLDCADALCSIVFASTLEQQHVADTPITPGKGRPSIQPPRPSQFLVDSKVLDAIGSLMSDEQLPETRWRCSASLWALSSVPEYRRELVELGATPMLVNESYRAAKIASLNTLQCCAGALCNLTIVPEETNAAKMVAEGAMPALIQLAKLENDTIREHCTLALSNLSGPSPTVESGAVSALLNLSMDLSSSASGPTTAGLASRRGSQQQPAVLSRPPIVCGERHKQFAVLPDYAMELTQDRSLDERKFEAELAASMPPPPHLPTIAADLVGLSSTRLCDSKSKPSAQGENVDLVSWKSEAASQPVVQRDDGACEYMETRFFGKVDPEESLAFMTETEERDEEEDDTWAEARPMVYASGNQEQDPLVDSSAEFPKGSPNQGETTRSPVQSYGNSGRRMGALGAGVAPTNYPLSPLSRVVAKKTHAAHVARKFKDSARRKSRKDGDIHKLLMLGSKSSPCLTKTTSDSEPTGSARRGITDHAPSERKTPQPAPMSRPPSQLASLSVSTSTSSLPTWFGASETTIDSQAALLAAVSAAGLYGAPPPRVQDCKNRLDDSKGAATSLNAKQQKKKAAVNRRRKEQESSSDSTSELLAAQPKSLPPATTIEEFQGQAKLLGLWS
ncbi:ARM protein [Phytophthora pseudosyringae]|uniref:ARM protein n=1 Tax=Phytophthora pseudosyringae TaxID=221518 RepID=A0A8T1V8U6_9STRA|nr:ARM protein [Phytophthora pseudosyringae]